MVGLYFDFEFVNALSKRKDLNESIVYDFCNQFLKRTRGVEVYVNLESLTVLNELISSNNFWYDISEIAPIQLFDFKSLLDTSKFYKKNAVTKFLFVENSDEDALQAKYSTIFISNSSLAVKWKLFQSNRDDSELLIKSNPAISESHIFRSWADMSLFAHPIKNMILFDFYIASDKSSQRIEDNLLPLLKSLLKDSLGKTNDLAIFTSELSGCKSVGKKVSWSLSDMERNLAKLSKLRPMIANIQFINYDSTKVRTDPEHNRFLLTNYFLIRTEAGFNIFKNKTGLVNKRDNIRFDSILNNKTRNLVGEIVKNLNLYCSTLKSEYLNYQGEYEHFYVPPLQSKFFSETINR